MNEFIPSSNGTPEKDPRIAYFDKHAPRWIEYNSPEQIITRFDAMKDEIGITPGRNVLEIGCGPGQFTGWICEQVAPGKVMATDFSPAMIAEACKQSLSAEFMVSDICSEAPAVKAFHTAFCYNSFPHFRDKSRALKNIAKTLKPGGVLVILHFAGREALNNMHSQFGGPVQNDHLLEHEEMEKLIVDAGFKIDIFRDESDLYFIRAQK